MVKLSTRKICGIVVVELALMLVSLLLPVGAVREYAQVAIIAGAVFASVLLQGWAKPRTTESKTIAIIIVLAAIVFQVVMFVLLGIKLGFARNVYAYNFASIFHVFLPVILAIIGEEVLRGQLVDRGRGNRLMVVMTGAMIYLTQIIIALPLYDFSESKSLFTFIVTMAGPAILQNTLLTFIAYQYDYRVNIIYRLIMELPTYLLPIMPNAGTYLPAIFEIGLVLILTIWLVGVQWRLRSGTNWKNRRQAKIKRTENEQTRKAKRALRYIGWGAGTIVIVGYVALMSGLFKYHFLAIGSGSMEPHISRGDMILAEKSDEYGEMDVGEVLVYRHSNVIMVHRISEVNERNGKRTFITKGDANNAEDKWTVEQGDIIGTAKGKIAMFGYPTLWLYELFNTN